MIHVPKISEVVFHDPHVAALAWAVGSEPLMYAGISGAAQSMIDSKWCRREYESYWNVLKELDSNPDSLHRFIEADNPTILGKYFETLFAFWIRSSGRFELLARNIRFEETGKTEGEADFLVSDHENDDVIHIETACKYYLGYGNSSAHANWIGPNGTDTLELKMSKLKRQIGLMKMPAARRFLNEHKWNVKASKVFMKGYFFHHYKLLTSAVHPVGAAGNYNSGWYIRQNELYDFIGELNQWVILPKLLWPPLHNFYDEVVAPVDGSELFVYCQRHFQSGKKALLIAQVIKQDGIIHEISRGFVVDNKWPFL